MSADTQAEVAGEADHGIQVFAAPSDAPRVRWRTDLISAGFSASLLVFLIIVAGEGSTLDRTTLQFVGELPGWLLWLGQIAYLVGVLYAFGLLIGVGVFARHRLELLRDMLLAATLAVALALLLSRFIDERWPEFAFFDLDETRDTFPAFFVTTSVAIQAAASPHLTAPMRKVGWTCIMTAAAASVLGGVTTVSDALGAVLVGLFSAAIVRFVFGSTAGVPSVNRVRSGLAELGVSVDELRYADAQPTETTLLTGTSADGASLLVSVLGRDAWGSRRWARRWRAAWYQDRGAQHESDRRQQVEHEALAMYIARRHGVSVPDVVAVGMTSLDDAILVSDLYDRPLQDVAVDDVDDALLDGIWGELGKLHDAGLSHGSIDDLHVWFDSAGAPALVGFGYCTIHAGDEQLDEDVAALLVTTSLIVGTERAIDAARSARGDDALAAMLPVLQAATLNSRLRHQARKQKLKIDDLREQTATAVGTDVPDLERLQRVSWKSVVLVVFVGFAAYTIIGSLADVGFDTIVDSLADARWGLVLIALVLVGVTNYTDTVSVAAVTPKPIPVGVTTVEQFAIGFVNVAVPSAAGRVGTNVRFFQKLGINSVTSSTTGAITGLLGFVAEILLIVLTILGGKGSIDFSQLSGAGGVIRLLVMAVLLFVGATVVVAVVPKLRHWAWAKLRGPVSQIGEGVRTLKSPKNAALAIGGAIGTEVLFASALTLCVLAVGGSVSLGEAIFINVTVSLFAGLMPVPGGIGVTEAGLSAGLTAVGVPSDIAVSAVVVYRVVSYYLPPVWGYVCLRWLTRHDYL
ncbi:MAG: flippase-like domain-containing protein [Ilumatobacteraceae bacterium]